LLHIVAIPCTAAEDLRTVAERSAFTKTGRYEEVVALCAAFQRAYPAAVRCEEFGPARLKGRPMLALIASRTGAVTPESGAGQEALAGTAGLQGCIHAGEIGRQGRGLPRPA